MCCFEKKDKIDIFFKFCASLLILLLCLGIVMIVLAAGKMLLFGV